MRIFAFFFAFRVDFCISKTPLNIFADLKFTTNSTLRRSALCFFST